MLRLLKSPFASSASRGSEGKTGAALGVVDLISRADALNQARNWGEATTLYRQVLDKIPLVPKSGCSMDMG